MSNEEHLNNNETERERERDVDNYYNMNIRVPGGGGGGGSINNSNSEMGLMLFPQYFSTTHYRHSTSHHHHHHHHVDVENCLEKGGESSGPPPTPAEMMQQQQQQQQKRENTAKQYNKMITGECRHQKRRRSALLHNLTERLRRQRLKEKMKTLQEMIPNCNKRDKASALDDIINYIKTLQYQAQMMSMGAGLGLTMLYSPWMISTTTQQAAGQQGLLMHATGQLPPMMKPLGNTFPCTNSLVPSMSWTPFCATTTSDPSHDECTSNEETSSSQGASSSRFE
ncbi:hypothetical protein ACJIZ3_001506 [Penstemon smallii]|uniref:BHLH domain-containing protein n=1 Tax=Penstemon smallii TaxID=265156 RepID=A0ABD3U696_9LAMI